MIFCSYTMIVTIVLQQGAQMKRKPETKRLDPAAKEALQQFKANYPKNSARFFIRKPRYNVQKTHNPSALIWCSR